MQVLSVELRTIRQLTRQGQGCGGSVSGPLRPAFLAIEVALDRRRTTFQRLRSDAPFPDGGLMQLAGALKTLVSQMLEQLHVAIVIAVGRKSGSERDQHIHVTYFAGTLAY